MSCADRVTCAALDRWMAAVRVAASLTVAYDLCVDVTGQVVLVEGVEDADTTRTYAGQLEYDRNSHFPL